MSHTECCFGDRVSWKFCGDEVEEGWIELVGVEDARNEENHTSRCVTFGCSCSLGAIG